MRVPISLVAVFTLIALVVGVLIGGGLLQDWNVFQKSVPAGQPSELAQLQARPIVLPVLKTGDQCPETPLNALPGGLFPSGFHGAGPVYVAVAGGSSVSNAWGTYWYLATITRLPATGLIVIRGQDLLTGQPVVFIGSGATGRVAGSDTVNGRLARQYFELVLDPLQGTINSRTMYWGGFMAGLAAGASGCMGWQIDTTGFDTEVVVTRSIPG